VFGVQTLGGNLEFRQLLDLLGTGNFNSTSNIGTMLPGPSVELCHQVQQFPDLRVPR
jgi:hypothetical protein